MVLIVAAVGLLVPSVSRRVAVVALAIPTAMAANVVRITALGLVAHWFGPEAVKNPFHDLIGRTVWAMTVVSLVVLAWRLGQHPRTPGPLGQQVSVPS